MSGPRITDAAVEAGGDALYDYLFEFGLNGTDASNAAEKVLTAALPHIERAVIQRLIEKYASERTALANASDYGSHDRTARMLSYAIGRLRAELDGRNGE